MSKTGILSMSGNNFKLLASMLVFMLFSFSILAQEPTRKNRFDEIKTKRKAFIAEKLALTSDESQAFWPIYQKYVDDLDDLKIETAKSRRTLMKQKDNLSEAELDKMMNNELANDQKIIDLRKRYHTEFRKALSAKKVLNLYMAERQFKETLIKRIQEKGGKANDFGD
jgi:hypothetical protein